MFEIVLDRPVEIGCWVCNRTNGVYTAEDSYAIGVVSNGEVKAGVVFDHWNGKSVAMHVAVEDPRAITRKFTWLCFDYAFNQIGADKLLGFVAQDNEDALNFDLKLGFEVEAVVRDACPGGDLLILTMTREQCRWLKLGERYGRQV